jgi:hypothetical protein
LKNLICGNFVAILLQSGQFADRRMRVRFNQMNISHRGGYVGVAG